MDVCKSKKTPEMTIDITKFGWSTKHGIMPVIAQQLIAPEALLDITSCGCRSEGKACSLKSCKCHNDGLSCTKYCTCESGKNVTILILHLAVSMTMMRFMN